MFAKSRGLTMIELLIGLAIGSLVVIGTVFVYSQTRTTYAINESQARLQEYGRYALAMIEPDIQLAGYYGFSNEANDFYYASGGSRTSVIDLESNDTALTTPAAIGTCGTNFVVDLLKSIAGSDGASTTNPSGPLATCAPPTAAPNNAGAFVAGTDTLTIRRSSTEVAPAASSSKIQLYLNSIKRTNQAIFSSNTAPGTITTTRQVRDLVVRTYYVAANSSSRVGFPTLWRKSLGTTGGAPAMIDEEILPGVEDFQVEFGIDDGDHDGVVGVDPAIDKAAPIGMPDYFNGIVSRWVKADNSLLDATIDGRYAQIVAVRVWLRIRADAPETAYTDTRTYDYAGITPFTITGAAANSRRVLMSRTVYLRNARLQ
ncbi:MAG TPA: PilW family protein [Steroidobacteraceae bacterium]|jgi:type IV pilus assembly protein PilW|nr:PilW family protein [Steroidobacteraceae bacterium]